MSDHNAAERIREEERQRIARDLHDELGSHLTAIKMALAQVQQQVSATSAEDGALQAQAAYADQLIDGALDAMHEIIDDLHPAVLALGLPAALEWLATSFARQTDVPHDLFVAAAAAELQLDSWQSVSLYRIAREALHNAARHAQAQHIHIALRVQQGLLILEISDDGVGLPATAAADLRSSGIRNMHARAAAMGATLTLAPGTDGGTLLRLSLSAALT